MGITRILVVSSVALSAACSADNPRVSADASPSSPLTDGAPEGAFPSGGIGGGGGVASTGVGAASDAASTGAGGAPADGAGIPASGGATVTEGGVSAAGGTSARGGGTSAAGGAISAKDGGSSVGGSMHASGGGTAKGGGTSASGGGTPASGGSTGVDGSAGAWRPFNDQSPWNTPIGNSPSIDPNSVSLVDDLSKSMGASTFIWINLDDYSIPVYWADATTPNRSVKAAIVGGEGFGTADDREGVTATIPIPDGATPAVGTDAHLCVVDRPRNTTWGLWSATVSGSTYGCQVGASIGLSGTGVHPPATDSPWWKGTDARACGFPLIAGLMMVEEVQKGQINHALVLAYPHIKSRYFTPPASTAQATTSEALPTRGIPCGGRVQLDPSLNLDTLGLSATGKIIARALQVYGAFIGDYSGSVSLYAESAPSALTAWEGVLSTGEVMNKIPLTSFRVLTLGTLLDNGN